MHAARHAIELVSNPTKFGRDLNINAMTAVALGKAGGSLDKAINASGNYPTNEKHPTTSH
jgi:hypothetical protein